jgi:hypothetical protein
MSIQRRDASNKRPSKQIQQKNNNKALKNSHSPDQKSSQSNPPTPAFLRKSSASTLMEIAKKQVTLILQLRKKAT